MFNAPQNIGHGPTCKSEDFIPFYNLEIEQNAIGEPKISMLNVQWNMCYHQYAPLLPVDFPQIFNTPDYYIL